MDTTPPADGKAPMDDVTDGTASDGTASDGTASDGTASDGTASDVDATDPGARVEVPSAERSDGQRWSSPAVAAAAQSLDSVAERPLGEHPDAFGSVHGELQRALADIDDA